MEEQVVGLAGLAAAVEGIGDSIAFGAPLVLHGNDDDHGLENHTEADADEDDEENLPPEDTSPIIPIRRKRRTQSSLDLLETQVKQQRQFHQDVLGALRTQNKNLDNLAYYGRQISKRLTESQVMQADQLREQRRHNLELEKIALEKLKVKREILAIQLSQL